MARFCFINGVKCKKACEDLFLKAMHGTNILRIKGLAEKHSIVVFLSDIIYCQGSSKVDQ